MNNYVTILTNAVTAMGGFVNDALFRELEPIRVARAVYSLIQAGCSANSQTFKTIARQLSHRQHPEGGWSDPEVTTWALGAIGLVKGGDTQNLQPAREWLHSERKPTGGWGKHPRDRARIPTTALVAALQPDVLTPEDINWMINEWRQDFGGPVRLSYKAGFFLLATPQGQEAELVKQTIDHLAQDQNDDGGFAPWRDHPIGSDPWSTGVVLWGLSRWSEHVSHAVLEKVLNWLQETQLPSGYWPYHYLDDGTSLALIGSVAALKSLKALE